MIHIGFTGTRHGMTDAQASAVLLSLLSVYEPSLMPEPLTVHHGDCVGADEQFHRIATQLSIAARSVAHPGNVRSLRAFTKADEIRKPKPMLLRNLDIVLESDRMLATPAEKNEQLRSGTWSTIRAARRHCKPLIIVYPDGTTGGGWS